MAVTGIGGVFFRAKDPDALAEWYKKHLGVFAMDESYEPWKQAAGPAVFLPFAADTDYFGSATQQFMINFRVDDLDGMIKQLKQGGVKIVKEIEEQEGVGRFAHIEDPEGNRIELWEPTD
ncbi:MAG: putative enzyme related to lactoylglutathione lyase [Candidatus Saccharibacteria bacterium]|nr:putative enzyme related to lactoylglutathione lyase [Candidatus Saccharibacteria bacterium]